ncbi:hypothetical protein E6W36_13595 [Hankyongella ginsenosidimutans]|uniref:Uncharacterized protein n=1 Tax=Hankyongella ginsenosidimutans TaxID=1763828 RepID=A0A4D7C4Z3_9SPHN|nr:hypothetical protein E6W36_13595 [Hankyongella ginsenosidimutans]
MEPRASTPGKRLEAIRLLAERGVPVNVFVSPVIPTSTTMRSRRSWRRRPGPVLLARRRSTCACPMKSRTCSRPGWPNTGRTAPNA